MKKLSTGLISTGLSLLPLLALGAVNPGTGALPSTEQAVYNTINTVINWLFAFLMIGAVLVIIIAAFTFLTAAGDPDKTKTARNYITYAIVAVVVGFLAKAIVVLVGNMLGVTTGGILF